MKVKIARFGWAQPGLEISAWVNGLDVDIHSVDVKPYDKWGSVVVTVCYFERNDVED